MHHKYDLIERSTVSVHCERQSGVLDYGRQMIGIGGSNACPIPEPVRKPVAELGHCMIRVFLQEYFFIYPDHDVFDWTRLDAFMDSVAQTGCQVLASICIKPKPLYPEVNPRIFMPNDMEEWKRVIRALVRRYSVERRLVTYWGVLNEINIGENGGCPHEIPDPEDYYAFYRETVDAIVSAWPDAKVGGPSLAGFDEAYLRRFVELCARDGTQMDFVSYNIYSGNPKEHADAACKAKEIVAGVPGNVEVFQTELNTWFPDAYVEETAYSGRYAASLAAVLMELNDSPITGSFQFDMYDVYVDPDDFERFYSITPFMLRHWNEIPHRFGLFDMDGRVRPQYFVYWMLREMHGERLETQSDSAEVRVSASVRGTAYQVLLTNYGEKASQDRVIHLNFSAIERGRYRLEVYRIDDAHGRMKEASAPALTESRLTFALPDYSMDLLLTADSVTLVRLVPA